MKLYFVFSLFKKWKGSNQFEVPCLQLTWAECDLINSENIKYLYGLYYIQKYV
jgi:hypothetical protein